MVDILLGTQHVGIRGLKGLENHGRNVLPTVLVKPKKVVLAPFSWADA